MHPNLESFNARVALIKSEDLEFISVIVLAVFGHENTRTHVLQQIFIEQFKFLQLASIRQFNLSRTNTFLGNFIQVADWVLLKGNVSWLFAYMHKILELEVFECAVVLIYVLCQCICCWHLQILILALRALHTINYATFRVLVFSTHHALHTYWDLGEFGLSTQKEGLEAIR